jgi:putative PIN family toxin of toxin-antitoxin system
MIRAVLDTNVFIRALIGRGHAASARVVDALRTGRFRSILSPAVVSELAAVLRIDSIRSLHQLTDDFVLTMLNLSEIHSDVATTAPALARDKSDTKFLDLANSSGADYLVTNDRRHLLRLRRHFGFGIVTPSRLLTHLGESAS